MSNNSDKSNSNKFSQLTKMMEQKLKHLTVLLYLRSSLVILRLCLLVFAFNVMNLILLFKNKIKTNV